MIGNISIWMEITYSYLMEFANFKVNWNNLFCSVLFNKENDFFFHIIKNLEIHTSCGIVFERIFRTKEFEKEFGQVCVIVSLI